MRPGARVMRKVFIGAMGSTSRAGSGEGRECEPGGCRHPVPSRLPLGGYDADGDAEGDIAPEVRWGSLKSPFVRIDFLGGTDLLTVGLNRIWGDMTYHVYGAFHWKGSGRPDRTEVNAIGDRLDQLLHGHAETTALVDIHSFREESEPTPAVPDGESVWLQSGGSTGFVLGR
jgi:hypothetical protein